MLYTSDFTEGVYQTWIPPTPPMSACNYHPWSAASRASITAWSFLIIYRLVHSLTITPEGNSSFMQEMTTRGLEACWITSTKRSFQTSWVESAWYVRRQVTCLTTHEGREVGCGWHKWFSELFVWIICLSLWGFWLASVWSWVKLNRAI